MRALRRAESSRRQSARKRCILSVRRMPRSLPRGLAIRLTAARGQSARGVTRRAAPHDGCLTPSRVGHTNRANRPARRARMRVGIRSADEARVGWRKQKPHPGRYPAPRVPLLMRGGCVEYAGGLNPEDKFFCAVASAGLRIAVGSTKESRDAQSKRGRGKVFCEGGQRDCAASHIRSALGFQRFEKSAEAIKFAVDGGKR